MTLPMDIRIASSDGPLRLRLRPPRHRAGGRVELVPAPARRHQPGGRVVLHRPRLPRRRGARRAARESRRRARDAARHGARHWRARSPTTRRPSRSTLTRALLWRMLGADHPMEAHKVDSQLIYELRPSRPTRPRASRRSWRSGRRGFRCGRAPTCRTAGRGGRRGRSPDGASARMPTSSVIDVMPVDPVALGDRCVEEHGEVVAGRVERRRGPSL